MRVVTLPCKWHDTGKWTTLHENLVSLCKFSLSITFHLANVAQVQVSLFSFLTFLLKLNIVFSIITGIGDIVNNVIKPTLVQKRLTWYNFVVLVGSFRAKTVNLMTINDVQVKTER